MGFDPFFQSSDPATAAAMLMFFQIRATVARCDSMIPARTVQ
jgi:hypothetical protein